MPNITVPPSAVDPNKAIRVSRLFAYPKQVLYLLSAFIFLISLHHFLTLAYNCFTARRQHPGRRDSSVKYPIQWSRLPTAVADSIRAVTFRYTVSLGPSYTINLAELSLTLGYIGILLSWVFVNTTNLQGMHVDPKYFADRAGLLAASQVPIMAALGMRNNIISWITGISYIKINYLHRLSARVICVLAWVHGGGRITIGLTGRDAITNRWLQCGPLTVSTLTVMCILTVRPIRNRAYETFLAIHFICAFIVIMGLFFHLSGHNLTYYGVWPAMIIWGADRLLRLLQLVMYNPASALFPTLFPPKVSPAPTDASVELLGPHFMRITVKRPAGLAAIRWCPGQNAYIAFPTLGGAPLASHPFTIASLDVPNELNKTLIFLVRVRRGTTARLAAEAHPSVRFPVLLNGPCSAPPTLADADTAVLFAGGSGVAFTLPLFLDVVRRAQAREPACSRVLFVWAVRNIDDIQWIASFLLPALTHLPSSLSLSVQLYITAPSSNLHFLHASDEREEGKDLEKDGISATFALDAEHGKGTGAEDTQALLVLPCVSVRPGRPDVSQLLSEELRSASGHMTVCVCGTHGLAESVRTALRTPRPGSILRGGATVSLHLEAFGGA